MSSRIILNAAAGSGGAGIADLFKTVLYVGPGSTTTVTTNVDILNNGGFIWCKNLDQGATPINFDHVIMPYQSSSSTTGLAIDPNLSQQGTGWYLASSSPISETGWTTSSGGSLINYDSNDFVSWNFVEGEKFFSFVKFTGNDSNRTVAHTLNSTPGMIWLKRVSPSGSYDWCVYHRSVGADKYLVLNSTAAAATSSTIFNDTAPTSSVFSVGTSSVVNASPYDTYSFVFGHDTAARGNIYCDSYTGNGSSSGPTVSIGWQPQFLLIKRSDSTGPWVMYDTVRDASNPLTAVLYANDYAAQTTGGPGINVSGTGFTIASSSSDINANTGTYIYMAIRSE